jgi:hypothetical protein
VSDTLLLPSSVRGRQNHCVSKSTLERDVVAAFGTPMTKTVGHVPGEAARRLLEPSMLGMRPSQNQTTATTSTVRSQKRSDTGEQVASDCHRCAFRKNLCISVAARMLGVMVLYRSTRVC